ncbi:hypothetical protein D3C81_1775990 [compost metagenome]
MPLTHLRFNVNWAGLRAKPSKAVSVKRLSGISQTRAGGNMFLMGAIKANVWVFRGNAEEIL